MARTRPLMEDFNLMGKYGQKISTAFLFVYNLSFHRCTSTVTAECTRQALSYSILPPVISARLTTKERFVLRYGKIEIRAKFPQGDWLYPGNIQFVIFFF